MGFVEFKDSDDFEFFIL